jgi:hypothetical protein
VQSIELGKQAHVLECVAAHQAPLGLAQAGIAELTQLLFDEAIGTLAAWGLEAQRFGALEKDVCLLQRLEPFGLECHGHHPPMMPGTRPSSGSCVVGRDPHLEIPVIGGTMLSSNKHKAGQQIR